MRRRKIKQAREHEAGRCPTGSKRLIMPDTCPGQPSAQYLACSGQASSVSRKRTIGHSPAAHGQWLAAPELAHLRADAARCSPNATHQDSAIGNCSSPKTICSLLTVRDHEDHQPSLLRAAGSRSRCDLPVTRRCSRVVTSAFSVRGRVELVVLGDP